MTKTQKILLVLLRVALGSFMFYAGITKVLDPTWSAAGYLAGAKTLPVFYHWLAQPNVIPFIDFINKWGLTLLGVSLISGTFVKWSSICGAVLMLLYYLPILDFPHPDAHSYIVDQHVVFALLMLYFASIKAGRVWGLDGILSKNKS